MSNIGIYNKYDNCEGVQKPERVFTEKDLKHPDQVVDYLLRNFDPKSAQAARKAIRTWAGNNIKYLFKSKKNKIAAWENIIYIITGYYKWTENGYKDQFLGDKRFSDNGLGTVPVSAPNKGKKLSSRYNQLQNSHGATRTRIGTEEVDEPRTVGKAVYTTGSKKEAQQLLRMIEHVDHSWLIGVLNCLSRLSDISRIKDVTLGKNPKRNNAELHQEMLLEEESKGAILERHIENKRENAKSKEDTDKQIKEIKQRYDETLAKYKAAIERLHQTSDEQTQQDRTFLDNKSTELEVLSGNQQEVQDLLAQLTDLEKEKQRAWEHYVYWKGFRQKDTLRRERERFDRMFPGVRKTR